MPATLDDVLAEVKALRAVVDALTVTADRTLKGTGLLARHLGAVARPAAAAPPEPPGIASAQELDAVDGDPVVEKNPPRWKGEGEAGRPMSLCSSAYLISVAEGAEWKVNAGPRAGKEQYFAADAAVARKTARLARGWAERRHAAEQTEAAAQQPPTTAEEI